MDNKFIIIYLILGILIVKTFFIKENMSNTDVKKLIEENYKIDVSSIRNLSKLSNDLTTNGKLDVHGGLNIKGNFNLLPKGIITAWNSATAPEGWALCDGNNGTPDLRGRFILGAGQGAGLTNRALNGKGGEEKHKLAVTELPAHNHKGTTSTNGNHDHKTISNKTFGGGNKGYSGGGGHHFGWHNPQYRTSTNGNHKHTFTSNNTGGNQPHNNMPPFYVLTYIMKL